MKISKHVDYIGVMNPNLRIFDIVMQADYGTTYNAYIVRDSKNVLVETVHEKFFDEWVDNINALCGVDKIDYLIMNHTEPDHSGSIAKLLELNPNITVYASTSGIKFIQAIANAEIKHVVANEGDTLNLGATTLKFISAPFLHWPDSIFTYCEQDKVLFTCDMFGAHYCEPGVFDTKVRYHDAYDKSFKGYYDAIFGPFKPYVISAIDKIKDLAIDYVCTSHGPVLSETFAAVKDKYAKWSAPTTPSGAVVVYASAYGYTEMLAQAIAKGIADSGISVKSYDVLHAPLSEITESIEGAEYLAVGSPTINRDAVKPIWDVLTTIDAIGSGKKKASAFGSYGWSGEAVKMMEDRLKSLKFKLIGENMRVNFKPTAEDLNKFYEHGKSFGN